MNIIAFTCNIHGMNFNFSQVTNNHDSSLNSTPRNLSQQTTVTTVGSVHDPEVVSREVVIRNSNGEVGDDDAPSDTKSDTISQVVI